MGWKEGAGLGANEDGRIVPVKATMKLDNRGLGCTLKDADSWIAHQEEFDDILALLNQSADIEDSSASQVEAEDSPKDKKEDGQRRFYGRFSRGGVKTLRTTEDLNCILGRRKSKKKSIENKQENGSEGSNDTVKEDDKTGEKNVDKVHGVVTVTSSCSVQDYFAQKMKNRNLPAHLKAPGDDDVQKATDSESDRENNPCKDTYVKSKCSVQEYFAQKMKARNEKMLAKSVAEDKSSEDKPESSCEEDNDVSNGDETNIDTEKDNSESGDKKKRNNKKSKQLNEAVSSQDVHFSSTESSQTESKKDKKKRKRDEVDTCDVTAEGKEKRKKKRKGENETCLDEKSVIEDKSTPKNKKEKKRDKKKNKSSKCDIDNGTENGELMECDAHSPSENHKTVVEKEDGDQQDVNGGNDKSTLSKKSKNAKKKQKYKIKQNIINKLQALRDMDGEKWQEQMKLAQVKACKDMDKVKGNMLVTSVSVKSKIISSKKTSGKEKVEKFNLQMKELKEAALLKASELNDSASSELKTAVESAIRKTKQKKRKNISLINKMAEEHESVDINWQDEIMTLQHIKVETISGVKKSKKEIMKDLKRKFDEVTKLIEGINGKMEMKEEKNSSGPEECFVFPGATSVKGYLS